MAKVPQIADPEPPVGAVDARLDNPYTPGASYVPPPPASAATVIKLWAGGEHRRATDLAASLNLSDDDKALVRASCPGWGG